MRVISEPCDRMDAATPRRDGGCVASPSARPSPISSAPRTWRPARPSSGRSRPLTSRPARSSWRARCSSASRTIGEPHTTRGWPIRSRRALAPTCSSRPRSSPSTSSSTRTSPTAAALAGGSSICSWATARAPAPRRARTALSRGFTRDALCEDTAESLLRYDAARGYDEYHKLASSSPTAKALLHGYRAGRCGALCATSALTTGSRWRRRGSGGRRGSTRASSRPSSPPSAVFAAAGRGCFVPFGVGPLLVLLSSVAYWANPVKASVRRKVDLVVVRTGLACQVALAAFCTSHRVRRCPG